MNDLTSSRTRPFDKTPRNTTPTSTPLSRPRPPPNFGDPDDIENWERAQRGLELVPDVEWLHTGRGDDGEEGDHYGVTNEAPMRAYQREWLRLMQHRSGENP